MRGFLFNSVAQIFAVQIAVVNWVCESLLKMLGNTGYFFMKAIDSKRLEVYSSLQEAEGGTELSRQSMELRLLASAAQVRDHARETEEWTDRHTDALNAIGDALMVEADWEEESVHQYLKELVESIDGLEYGTEDW